MEQLSSSLPFYGFVESRQGGRPENQDWLGFTDTWLGLLVVVCDGMGGGPGGKTASTVATNNIIESVLQSKGTDVTKQEALTNAIESANRRLLELQKQNPALRGMGTTVTALLINDLSATVAHMGDSRVYQLRFGRKQFRTRDHSQVMELVAAGTMTEEEARTTPNSNIITRAVGVSEKIQPEIAELPYEKGDRFVLCTDGVWNSMPEKELIPLLAKTSTPNGAVEKTMIAVNEIGLSTNPYHDNFTMALVETKRNSILQEKMTHKTRNLIRILLATIAALLLLVLILFAVIKSKAVRNEKTLSEYAVIKNERNELQAQISGLTKQVNDLKNDTLRLSENVRRMEEKEKIRADVAAEVAKHGGKKENSIPQNVEDSFKKGAGQKVEQAEKNVLSRETDGVNNTQQVSSKSVNEQTSVDDKTSQEKVKLLEQFDLIISSLVKLSEVPENIEIPKRDVDKVRKDLYAFYKSLRKSKSYQDSDFVENDVKWAVDRLGDEIAKSSKKAKGNATRKGHYIKIINQLKDHVILE